MDEYVGYVSVDTGPLLIGPVKLERKSEHLWLGWVGGWRLSIGRANPLALEGDRQYTGPWRVRVGQRRTTVTTVGQGVDWIEGVLLELTAFVKWVRRNS